jgi:hypothetical protein
MKEREVNLGPLTARVGIFKNPGGQHLSEPDYNSKRATSGRPSASPRAQAASNNREQPSTRRYPNAADETIARRKRTLHPAGRRPPAASDPPHLLAIPKGNGALVDIRCSTHGQPAQQRCHLWLKRCVFHLLMQVSRSFRRLRRVRLSNFSSAAAHPLPADPLTLRCA